MDDKEYTLDQIRSAQAEIAREMGIEGLDKQDMLMLEKASLHLRNLERLMMSKMETNLIDALKEESKELKALTKELSDASKRLFKLTKILKEIVGVTGRVIDILALVK